MGVMRILVVDPAADRRAELSHLICELPEVEVRGAVHGLTDACLALRAEPIDVIIAGELPLWELASLVAAAESLGSAVLEVTTDDALIAKLRTLVTRRGVPRAQLDRLAARSKYLVFERNTRAASTRALAMHLQSKGPDRAPSGTQTIDLRDWLPATIAQLRGVIPEYIELVPIVGGDIATVSCVPAVLEHVVLELVLQACTQLPWGGTVWLTASPGEDGEVKLDVLENGRGRVLDLVLRASAPASS